MKCKHLKSIITRDGKKCLNCGWEWRLVVAERRMNPKRKVWITHPQVHGNGGWCGDTLLSSSRGMQLQRALKIDPERQYDRWVDWGYYGRLGAIRISTKPDSNFATYYWHGGDRRWIKI